MKAGCSLLTLSLPKARIFRREPYVVATFTSGDAELAVACEPLVGVKRGRPFVGDIPLLPPSDLGDHITGRIEVWESDSDHRAFGERVLHAQQIVEGSQLLSKLAAGAALSVGPAQIGISQAAGVIGKVLAGAKDDRLAAFDVDLDADDLVVGQTYTLSSPRAVVQLLVTAEGEGLTVQVPEVEGLPPSLPSPDVSDLPPELAGLVALLDLTDPEVQAAFESWRDRDGSLDGLQALVVRWRDA